MENPRLTFVTPTVIAGDRSLVNVVAHELAHAWTGNLVTNASAEHFWLNEGFTVYAERRILEALEGASPPGCTRPSDCTTCAHPGAIRRRPQLTRLRTDLLGVDPDEAYSTVPYEKGYLLLRKLEETAGRAAWDEFLRAYLAAFRFQSITTQDFLDFLEQRLPGSDVAGAGARVHRRSGAAGGRAAAALAEAFATAQRRGRAAESHRAVGVVAVDRARRGQAARARRAISASPPGAASSCATPSCSCSSGPAFPRVWKAPAASRWRRGG